MVWLQKMFWYLCVIHLKSNIMDIYRMKICKIYSVEKLGGGYYSPKHISLIITNLL